MMQKTNSKSISRRSHAHFSETSELINNLTQSYKDVHEHLADGALKLATADVSKRLIDAGDGNLTIGREEITAPEPPRDWAPKSGQLSEDFWPETRGSRN